MISGSSDLGHFLSDIGEIFGETMGEQVLIRFEPNENTGTV